MELESRSFFEPPTSDEQFGHQDFSLAIEPEYRSEWDEGHQRFAFVPYARVDQHDSNRTHADIRELNWLLIKDSWDLRVGIGKVFWGVTEANHLVDVINQTDLVENIDGEDKLGQPMVHLSLYRDSGIFGLFILPGFRERTFPSPSGRLRTIPPVDEDLAEFESGAGDEHVDFALRWSQVFGDWDIGLAHFHGTSRDPQLVPTVRDDGEPVLAPRYDLIDQTSIDLQGVKGSWLLKLEALTRSRQGERYSALGTGFEYTVVGVLDTSVDLGILGEYWYDERRKAAPTIFQDDIFVGLRLAMNDVHSTEALVGVLKDRHFGSHLINVEASRRLGNNFTLSLEARFFHANDTDDPMFAQRQDDYLQLALNYWY